MVMINLLPWRVYVRRYEQKHYWLVVGGALSIATLIVLLVYVVKVVQIHALESQIDEGRETLQALIRLHDLSHKHDRQQTAALDDRPLFSLMSHLSGVNVCFQAVSRQKNRVMMVGRAVSADEVFSVLQQWSDANLFSNVKLIDLRQRYSHAFLFRIQAIERTTDTSTLTMPEKKTI